MAKLLHEIWRADGTAITCCLAGPMGDEARAMLEPGSTLLQVFWAESSFEAGTIRNKILGFEPYRSAWEEIDSKPYPDDWLRLQNAARVSAVPATNPVQMSDQHLVDQLAAALMKAATKGAPADAERLIADLVDRRGADAVALFHRATRRSKKTTIALSDLLLVRGAAGCAISDQAIMAILDDRRHVARDQLLQAMCWAPHRRFAAKLREIARDRADPGWSWAVEALGKWRDRLSLDVLLGHTQGVDTPFIVIAALVNMRAPEAAIVFEAYLRHPEPRERIFALWGLAALGYEEAIGALIVLLDDPDTTTETSFIPGQSMRAAEALADIHGLAFAWADEAAVEKIRRHCRTRYAAADLARLAVNLKAGILTRTPLKPEGSV